MDHKLLPHCWVCQVRFNNQVPPGPANEERHHLMPRAYGGTDGPQVSLCDQHHTKLHKIATAILSGRAFRNLLMGESPERSRKLIWMASLVVKSKRATEEDPNKASKVLLVLSKDEQDMVAFIQKRRGIGNKPDVFHQALRHFFNLTRG